jgi:hypothetical protein
MSSWNTCPSGRYPFVSENKFLCRTVPLFSWHSLGVRCYRDGHARNTRPIKSRCYHCHSASRYLLRECSLLLVQSTRGSHLENLAAWVTYQSSVTVAHIRRSGRSGTIAMSLLQGSERLFCHLSSPGGDEVRLRVPGFGVITPSIRDD